MTWTGGADKRIFRLLTMTGGVVGVSRATWKTMPMLPGRNEIVLSRDPSAETCYVPRSKGTQEACQMTLGAFAYTYPGAWLIGGPAVVYEAMDIGLVDEVHMCEIQDACLGEGIADGLGERLLKPRSPFNHWGSTRVEDVVVWHFRRN